MRVLLSMTAPFVPVVCALCYRSNFIAHLKLCNIKLLEILNDDDNDRCSFVIVIIAVFTNDYVANLSETFGDVCKRFADHPLIRAIHTYDFW